MQNDKRQWIFSVLTFLILLFPITMVFACGDVNKINNEQLSYVQKMQAWSEKWHMNRVSALVREDYELLDELVMELKFIDRPSGVIPLEIEGKTLETFTFFDHDELISLHEIYVSAEQHKATIREYAENHDINLFAMDRDVDLEMLNVYRQNQEIINLTVVRLWQLDYILSNLFMEYLPER